MHALLLPSFNYTCLRVASALSNAVNLTVLPLEFIVLVNDEAARIVNEVNVGLEVQNGVDRPVFAFNSLVNHEVKVDEHHDVLFDYGWVSVPDRIQMFELYDEVLDTISLVAVDEAVC